MPVTFIGRDSIGRPIASHGLRLSDFTGWEAQVDADYHVEPDSLADADIIALTVKSGATADAARDIARHGREGALVIGFQNGIIA